MHMAEAPFSLTQPWFGAFLTFGRLCILEDILDSLPDFFCGTKHLQSTSVWSRQNLQWVCCRFCLRWMRRRHPIPVHSIHECACNRLLAKLMLTHLMLSSRICRWLHTHKQAGKAGRGQIGIIWREGVLSKEKFTNGGKWINLTQIYSRIIP